MPYHSPIPDSQPRSKVSSLVDAIVQAEKMIQVAFVLPCAAFIGWLGGAWLDRRLHQSWIALAGIVFGGVSGLVYVVRLALATDKQISNGGGTKIGNENKNGNTQS
jgi:ATP synthase protein I